MLNSILNPARTYEELKKLKAIVLHQDEKSTKLSIPKDGHPFLSPEDFKRLQKLQKEVKTEICDFVDTIFKISNSIVVDPKKADYKKLAASLVARCFGLFKVLNSFLSFSYGAFKTFLSNKNYSLLDVKKSFLNKLLSH